MNSSQVLLPKPPRYLKPGFDVKDPAIVMSSLEALAAKVPADAQDLINILEHYSEIALAIEDELSRRYVNMTVHADDASLEQAYNDYYANVATPAEPYAFRIKQLFYDSPFRSELSQQRYGHLNRMLAKQIELFREENLPLRIQESELANKYGGIVSKMTAQFDDKELTMAQLGVHLKDADRTKRETAWRLRMQAFQEHESEFDALYDQLRELRSKIAANTGFDNYRDYMHQWMGRFSYTPDDLYRFHDAVAKVVIPFTKELTRERKQRLDLASVKPWDTVVDLDGKVLKPFESTDEFIDKALQVLDKVNPDYATQLGSMRVTGLLDLENRKGKAPGGYNTTLNDLGASFIFMNHVKQHNDVVTLLHESGHAMHSAATKDIPISFYKDTPSEVAELASMSMELLSMDYWDIYYQDPQDLIKAKRDQLEGTLTFLPWCMSVDAFQHWVYTHPDHDAAQRREAFLDIYERFFPDIDWSGVEHYKHLRWMQQLHIFEVPFYYIEYGMAQLGALSVYMNYRENGRNALEAYQRFLELGYSKPVSELYQAAGIDFDFSEAKLGRLVDFVRRELASLS